MIKDNLGKCQSTGGAGEKLCLHKRGISLRWATVLLNVVQHGNHVVLLAGGCPGTAVFCAISCRQRFCRTIVQKQSGETPWPVPLRDVSPASWTKSVSSSMGYCHLKANHCINVKIFAAKLVEMWLNTSATNPHSLRWHRLFRQGPAR